MTGKTAFRIHYKNHHAPKETKKKTFPCGLCSKMFVARKSLDFHMGIMHQSKKCGACGLILPNSKEYLTHWKPVRPLWKHPTLAPFAILAIKCISLKKHLEGHDQKQPTEVVKITGPTKTTCPHCGKVYASKASFQGHYNNKHLLEDKSKKVFSCKHCPKAYGSLRSLDAHITSEEMWSVRFDLWRCKSVYCSLESISILSGYHRNTQYLRSL